MRQFPSKAEPIPQSYADAVLERSLNLMLYIIASLMCNDVEIARVNLEFHEPNPNSVAATVQDQGGNHIATIWQRVTMRSDLCSAFQHLRLNKEARLRGKIGNRVLRYSLQQLQSCAPSTPSSSISPNRGHRPTGSWPRLPGGPKTSKPESTRQVVSSSSAGLACKGIMSLPGSYVYHGNLSDACMCATKALMRAICASVIAPRSNHKPFCSGCFTAIPRGREATSQRCEPRCNSAALGGRRTAL